MGTETNRPNAQYTNGVYHKAMRQRDAVLTRAGRWVAEHPAAGPLGAYLAGWQAAVEEVSP